MSRLRAMLADRRSRQRGSVLSGLLIMVALLSIIIGALMTQLSSSFLLSRTLSERMQREATVNSAVELGLYQLSNSNVPPVCVRDTRGPWYVTSLNGSPAAVTQTCAAIMPDRTSALAGGSYAVNGIHEVANGHSSYIVGDQAGGLWSYPVGSALAEWAITTGGALTAPVLAQPDPDNYPAVELAVPIAGSGGQCGGHCVAVYDEPLSGAPGFVCDLPAGGPVVAQPAMEASAGAANFPDYVFFGDANGELYAYDTDNGCALKAQASGPAGAIVGRPLVYTGTVATKGKTTTVVSDIFTVDTTSAATSLVHWQYAESTVVGGGTASSLFFVSSVALAVSGIAVTSGPSTTVPTVGVTIRLAAAGAGGGMAIGSITVNSSKSGSTYSISAGPTGSVGAVVAAPLWNGGTIGVGSTNGTLSLFDTNLKLTNQYSGQADGSPAIRSTPAADANGDWYFGADDGAVYDVEIPTTGTQMFKAARFGPGGAVHSSPVVATCGTSQCVYFASTSAGAYFAQLGATRIIELRACITATQGSVGCAANPRLWARAEIGLPAVVGGQGIAIQGWSYYSP